MSARNEDKGTGLSLATLAIASAASAAAAIFIHEFWTGGAVLGAAITPIIVAVVSEMLKKPAERITTVRVQRREGAPAARSPVTASGSSRRPDPYGIWEADRRSPLGRVQPRHLKLALVTGLLAFVVGAVALTGAELVFGGSVGGGERTTIFSSDRDRGRDEDDGRDAPAATQPADDGQTEPVPAEPPPTATQPGQTTPAPGEEPVPAPEAAPAPGQTTPPGASTTPGAAAPEGG